jgi:hypothetical protein
MLLSAPRRRRPPRPIIMGLIYWVLDDPALIARPRGLDPDDEHR